MKRYRRTRWAAVAVMLASLLTWVSTSPGAAAPTQEEFNRGTGSAIADAIRVDPVAGGLSFGIGIGQALAGHQNTVGQAESRAYDLGVPGVTLAAEQCDGDPPTLPQEDQPQPERISSTEEGSEQGKQSTEQYAAGQIVKAVRATKDPLAEATTTGTPSEIPGVIKIEGFRSYARSGIIDGNLREAQAVTEIGILTLGGDAAVLKGLRWEAIHRTGAVDERFGHFTIESLEVAGVPTPVDDITQLNAILQPLGFFLRPPATHEAETSGGTIVIVDPLAISIVPSPTRDGILGPVLGAIHPVREGLFQAAVDYDCGTGTYITITDVAIASLTGGGTFSVSLGGVRATTAPLKLFQGLGQLGPLPPLAPLGGTPAIAAIPGTAGSPAIPAAPGAAIPSAPAAETGEAQDDAAERIADVSGERGGLMALVAGGGLLLLAAVAEADRRKMLRAQRAIPTEV